MNTRLKGDGLAYILDHAAPSLVLAEAALEPALPERFREGVVLRGTLAFGLCLVGAVVLNELVVYLLVNILLRQQIELFEQGMLFKTIFTWLTGMLIYQLLRLFLREEPIEATKRPTGW